jgi:hypothetical protein
VGAEAVGLLMGHLPRLERELDQRLGYKISEGERARELVQVRAHHTGGRGAES